MQNCFDNTSPDKIVVYMHVYIPIYIYNIVVMGIEIVIHA